MFPQAGLLARNLLVRRVAVQLKKSQLLYSSHCRRGLIQCPNGVILGSGSLVQRNTLASLWSLSVIQSRGKADKANLNLNTSSSEYDDKFQEAMNQSLLGEKEIVQEPQRNRFGILKALVIIIAGIYFGAWLAMIGAYVLEELDIFVDDDDDDD